MINCPNCGTDIEEGKKFCRQCGISLRATDEEATTWRLPSSTAPTPEPQRPTVPVRPPNTGQHEQPPQSMYVPPMNYYPPPGPVAPYQPPPAQAQGHISLGEWLSGGWQVYKENWLLMSLATLLGTFLSIVTAGILAGPLLMGLYRMAFKTMRGERPELGDLFNWQGRFLPAFLAFLISAAIYGGLTGAGNREPLLAVISFLVTPFLTIILGFTLPHILERKMDVAAAINEVGRLIFSRDALMWWIVGLVFATISGAGFFGLCVGVFITLPWIVSSSAVAYRDIFGLDDPNRTLH